MRSLAMVSRTSLPVLPPGVIAMPSGLRMQGGQFGARALRIMARNWPARFCAGWAALRCLWQVPGIESGGGLANNLLQPPPDTDISRAQGAGDGRDAIAARGQALRQLGLARTGIAPAQALANGIRRGSVPSAACRVRVRSGPTRAWTRLRPCGPTRLRPCGPTRLRPCGPT